MTFKKALREAAKIGKRCEKGEITVVSREQMLTKLFEEVAG